MIEEIKKIDEKCRIETIISMNKLKEYINNIQSGMNYKQSFEELINVTNQNIDDETLIKVLNYVVLDNNLQKYYDDIEEKDEYKKLYLALNKFFEDKFLWLEEKINEILDVSKNNLGNIVEEYLKNMSKSLDSLLTIAIKTIANIANSVRENIPSNEEIERRRKHHIKWAKFGWTIIPFESIDFFDYVPKKQKEADEICEAVLNNDEMEKIFKYLKKCIKPRNKINEAIKCYQDKYYVATAMQLTALIERELTELPLDNKNEKKPRGLKIIDTFKEKIEIEEKRIIEYYILDNLFAYLKILFKNGDDFKRQKFNINRNFLMHGWRDVKTTKIDCKKLFLALLNIELIWKYDECEYNYY